MGAKKKQDMALLHSAFQDLPDYVAVDHDKKQADSNTFGIKNDGMQDGEQVNILFRSIMVSASFIK